MERRREGKRERVERPQRHEAPPLKVRKHGTWWDQPPPGYEGVGADIVKLVSAAMPRIDVPIPPPAQIQRIRDARPLVPSESRLLCWITVENLDHNRQGFVDYTHHLFKSTNLAPATVEEATLGGIVGWLLPSPRHVAYLLAFPGKYTVLRPPGLTLGVEHGPDFSGTVFTNPETRITENSDDSSPETHKVDSDGRTVAFGPGENGQRLFESPHIEGTPVKSEALQILNAVPLNGSWNESEILEELRNLVPAAKQWSIVQSTLFVFPRVVAFFDSVEDCNMALHALAGQRVLGRRVVAAAIDETLTRFMTGPLG